MSDTDESFRSAAREWLGEAMSSLPAPPDPDDWPARRTYDCAWQRRLYEAGFAGLGLPKALGGCEASLSQQLIFAEESARAAAPPHGCGLVGLTHAVPTVLAEGTEDQQARLIPPILRGEEVWCQGFSETEAGSDLAALRCRAIRDGNDYVINGHKIWTTHAEVADWCELLVRTDPDASPHRGITYLALPMDRPGITVRPIRTLAGDREFAEVGFENVRCPVDLRIGAENDGWRIAMVTFSHERTTTFVGDLVRALTKADMLCALARSAEIPGGIALDDAGLQAELGRVTARLDAMWALTELSVATAESGGEPGLESLVSKVYVTEAIRQLDDIGAQVLGPWSMTSEDRGGIPVESLVRDRLMHTSFTIAGGTSEIQRNIVAERGLGLPKEPRWQ